MATLSTRLTALENMRPTRLIVLCMLQDGSEAAVPVNECIRLNGDFRRVMAGNSMGDVRKLLDYICGQNCAIC